MSVSYPSLILLFAVIVIGKEFCVGVITLVTCLVIYYSLDFQPVRHRNTIRVPPGNRITGTTIHNISARVRNGTERHTAQAFIQHGFSGRLGNGTTIHNISARVHNGTERHTAQAFIQHGFSGRLGNVLFQYASIYCLAKRHNLRPVFRFTRELNSIEDPDGLVVSAKSFSEFAPSRRLSERCCCCYDERLETILSSNQSYKLNGYFQSWKYFEPCKKDVLRVLAFKRSHLYRADRVMRDLRSRFPGQTLVGVHVRLGDYLKINKSSYGWTAASGAYYSRAMKYFRDRFARVVFVVFTPSRKWWQEHVNSSAEVTFQPFAAAPAVDLEVLSRLDHIIIGVGSFGWWAAYRNNGTVVHYKDFYRPHSKYGRQFWNEGKDFTRPGWIDL